jgi:hypothetical protein
MTRRERPCTHAPIDTQHRIAMLQLRWSAPDQTAMGARCSRHMDSHRRFKGGLRPQITDSSARSPTNDRCHLPPWPTPKPPHISPTSPSAQRLLNTPPPICLLLRHPLHHPACTRLIPPMPTFGTHQMPLNMMPRLLDILWLHRSQSGTVVTQRIL